MFAKWRGTLHSPNLRDWSLTLRLFNVISRTLRWWAFFFFLALCSLSWLGWQLNGLKSGNDWTVLSMGQIELTGTTSQGRTWSFTSDAVLCHVLDTCCGGGILRFCRDAVDIFFSTSQLGLKKAVEWKYPKWGCKQKNEINNSNNCGNEYEKDMKKKWEEKRKKSGI